MTASIRLVGGTSATSAPAPSATWPATTWTPLFWALKIGEAKRFTIECLRTTGGSEEMYPQSNIVRYEVPARGRHGAGESPCL